METNSHELLELSQFLFSLETRTPTANMMLWMKCYEKPCEKICCHSTDCGSIRCSGCFTYLTGVPPSKRLQCIECKILPPETLNNPRPEFCENCFENKTILHQHEKFLMIDSVGKHEIVLRKTGISFMRELNKNDFKIINESILGGINFQNKFCSICFENFSFDNFPVSFPGCEKSHGNAIPDKKFGLLDSKEFNHFECLMNWYLVTHQDKYCGEKLNLLYCKICRFEEENNSWRYMFESTKQEICDKYKNSNGDFYVCNEIIGKNLSISVPLIQEKPITLDKIFKSIKIKLIELHPQEWIRIEINEIF